MELRGTLYKIMNKILSNFLKMQNARFRNLKSKLIPINRGFLD